MRIFTLFLAFSLFFTALLIGQVDFDNDGMPDDFESTYSLDSNDPADAFADADGDGVLNLQESILNTDPNDTGSPVFYEHNADDPLENIYSRMCMGDTEPAIIRMTGGEYVFDYGFFAAGDYKLMIQGVLELDPTQSHYLEITDVNGQLLTNQHSGNQAIAKLDLDSYVSEYIF